MLDNGKRRVEILVTRNLADSNHKHDQDYFRKGISTTDSSQPFEKRTRMSNRGIIYSPICQPLVIG